MEEQGKRKREERKEKGDQGKSPQKKEEINLIEEDQPLKKKAKILKKKKEEEEEASEEQEEEKEEEEEEEEEENKVEVLKEIQQDWQERMKRWKKNKEYKAPIDDQDNGWIQISKVLAGVQSAEKKEQLKTCKRGELLELWGIPSYLTVKNEVSCIILLYFKHF
jgi:hypothetical protein